LAQGGVSKDSLQFTTKRLDVVVRPSQLAEIGEVI
jgi:hypothetical protein